MLSFTIRPPNRRRIRTVAIAAAQATALCGCPSVMRVPVPEHQKYSDGGVCADKSDMRRRAYPTPRMGCRATARAVSPVDRSKRGENLYNKRHKRRPPIPACGMRLTSSSAAPVDANFPPRDLSSPEKNGEAE